MAGLMPRDLRAENGRPIHTTPSGAFSTASLLHIVLPESPTDVAQPPAPARRGPVRSAQREPSTPAIFQPLCFVVAIQSFRAASFCLPPMTALPRTGLSRRSRASRVFGNGPPYAAASEVMRSAKRGGNGSGSPGFRAQTMMRDTCRFAVLMVLRAAFAFAASSNTAQM